MPNTVEKSGLRARTMILRRQPQAAGSKFSTDPRPLALDLPALGERRRPCRRTSASVRSHSETALSPMKISHPVHLVARTSAVMRPGQVRANGGLNTGVSNQAATHARARRLNETVLAGFGRGDGARP